MKTLSNHSNKNLNVAGYEVIPIPTGIFGLDGGAMFGTVPKVLWQKTNPSDEQNRIEMEARALLLMGHGRKILIDTGNGSDFIAKYGEKLGTKFSEMYNIDPHGASLKNSLKKHQIHPEDITDVILTHLHFDHAGGATTEKEGKIVPTFPKAQYHLQQSNLDNARQPNKREQASYFKSNFEPLIDHHQLNLLNDTKIEGLPYISLFVSNGHTQGHQSVLIEDSDTCVIYCGDVIPTSTHIRSSWVMGYDLNPLLLMEEKKQLLQRSLSKTTYYFFEHDPYCDIASVQPDKDDFKVQQRYWLTRGTT